MTQSNAAREPRDGRMPRPNQPERIREQRSKLRLAPPLPASGPRVPFMVMIVVLVIAGVVGILALNQKINENAFELDKLRADQAQLDQQEQNLDEQIAAKAAPGNLAANARKLGLVPAGAPAFIRLPDGRIVGVPQPATGQPSITSQGG
jgi:outer membrane murein-binding lipoprotein Lpp